jgi:hypothetical protein
MESKKIHKNSEIIDYSEYSTGDPFMIVNFDSIFESKGIPNSIKLLSSDILKDIINKEYNFCKNYDLNYNDFNVSFNLSIIDSERKDIYAISNFGIFSMNKLKGCSIIIYMDINNYDQIDLKRIITHEILHIYEVFNRIKNKSKKDLQWNLSKFLMNIRGKYKSSFINDFIYLIYLSLDHEINARVSETYTILMESRSKNKELLKSELEKTSAWKYSEYLINFDKNKYDIDYDEFLNFSKELNTLIRNKFKKLNNNIFIIPENHSECKKIITYWITIFRKKGKNFKSKLLKIIDEVITDISMIESAYIEVDNSLLEHGMIPYLLKYDKFLERESKINKITR